MVESQKKLSFYGVDVVQTTFNSSKKFNFETEIKFGIDVKLITAPIEKDFSLLMKIDLDVENFFSFSITAIGNFELNGATDDADRSAFINVNAPAIMFPYLRSIITTMTANFGGNIIPTIIIPPQFFKNEPLVEVEKP